MTCLIVEKNLVNISSDSSVNEAQKPAKKQKVDIATQTNVKPEPIQYRKISVETQTMDPVEKKYEVILEIPEKLIESVKSSRPLQPRIPFTQLVGMKVNEVSVYNFVGAFFNFDGMDNDEILKIQKMLVETSFEVCYRSTNARSVKHTKSILSA